MYSLSISCNKKAKIIVNLKERGILTPILKDFSNFYWNMMNNIKIFHKFHLENHYNHLTALKSKAPQKVLNMGKFDSYLAFKICIFLNVNNIFACIVHVTSIDYFVIIPLFCIPSCFVIIQLSCNHCSVFAPWMWLCSVYQWKCD